ncbi:MAG TPA: NAD-dependent epimerase/dehydratase family protein [Thermoanaerobaculaceae bacterium]|nr:NAD-dependent epimerase/dehydratase family protein [Thermoanaerobaculaceae bacterium]
MTAGTEAGWQPLPVEIGSDELRAWSARIPLPVAVTGASGFVGSHVLEALWRAGIRPRILARDMRKLCLADIAEDEVVIGDLDDGGALRQLVAGSRVVVHLAGVVRAPSAARFDRANRVGTENLVAAMTAVAPEASLVHASSLAAAGPSADPAGVAPEDPARPVSAYGRSKLAGEAAVRAFAGRWTILRPPSVYGPRDIDVLQFFRLAARGVVPVPAGERWVSVAHVADVVRAILAAAGGSGAGRVLHLGEPEVYRITDLIELIAAAGGVRARTVPLPAAVIRTAGLGGDLLQRLGRRRVALTSDKAREMVAGNWTARSAESLAALGLAGCVPFRDGARATWEWYRRAGWVPRAKMPRPY